MKKKIISILVIFTFVFTVACLNVTAQENDGIVISVGTTIFGESLDPVKGGMSYGYSFTSAALLKVAPNSEYVGDLAKEWSIGGDSLRYTFLLRDGIQFSDGSDLTADDVVFTYETVKENQALNGNVDLTKLASAKAIDAHTVEFTLSEPYSPFLDMTALLGIVPKNSYDSDLFDRQPIGAGPWRVVQYNANQQIIVEPNPYYYEGPPSIKKVTLVYMDSETALAAAKSGQLDVVMADPDVAHEKVSGMTMYPLETMDIRMMSLPTMPEQTMKGPDGNDVAVGNKVTSDVNVRKALSIGIDRKKVINNAFNGIGKPAYGFTDNLIWAYTEMDSDNRKDEAKTILEEAGWVLGSDGIREKDGVKCEFDVYTSERARYLLASAVAEDAAELGIKINPKNSSFTEIRKDKLQFSNPVVWGWGQYDPMVLRNLFYSGVFLKEQSANVGGYNNPKVDSFIERAISASSEVEAIKMWKEAQKATKDDFPYLYIVNIEHCYFVSDALDVSLDTQIPHPHGHGSPIICNMKDWKLK